MTLGTVFAVFVCHFFIMFAVSLVRIFASFHHLVRRPRIWIVEQMTKGNLSQEQAVNLLQTVSDQFVADCRDAHHAHFMNGIYSWESWQKYLGISRTPTTQEVINRAQRLQHQ